MELPLFFELSNGYSMFYLFQDMYLSILAYFNSKNWPVYHIYTHSLRSENIVLFCPGKYYVYPKLPSKLNFK